MKRAFRAFYRDESGNVILLIGLLFLLLFGFSVYAIDMSQTMLVRTQLQNAADAGALAGAFAYGPSGDTSGAVSAAMLAANANDALLDAGDANVMASVGISAADVTFPEAGLVRVTTHRTEATNDPFQNYFMRIFSPNGEVGEMTAEATAGFAWVCGGKCLKPWAVPDRWCDSAGTGDCTNGNGVFEPELGEYYSPEGTGYQDVDAGVPITIVPFQGQGAPNASLTPEFYYAIQFPAIGKEDEYSPANSGLPEYLSWISGCVSNNVTVEPGDLLPVQTGASPGNPQARGRVSDIIASDPNAVWDPSTKTVINSAYTESPRIVKFALIDPEYGVGSSPKHVKVAKIAVMFLENINGQGNISGRFMYLGDPDGIVCEDPSTPSFLYKTVLIE